MRIKYIYLIFMFCSNSLFSTIEIESVEQLQKLAPSAVISEIIITNPTLLEDINYREIARKYPIMKTLDLSSITEISTLSFLRFSPRICNVIYSVEVMRLLNEINVGIVQLNLYLASVNMGCITLPDNEIIAGMSPLGLLQSQSSSTGGRENVLFDSDRRQHVPILEMQGYHHYANGLVESNVFSQGSGALIGRNIVLTAAHCVWNDDTNSYYSNITFSPAHDEYESVYGKLRVKKVFCPESYQQRKKTKGMPNEDDYALLILESMEDGEEIGDFTGYLGIAVLSDDDLKGRKLTMHGYPSSAHGDRAKGKGYEHSGRCMEVSKDFVSYEIDSSPGQSGSGVYYEEDGDYYITAVHFFGGRIDRWGAKYVGNLGTRITKSRLAVINDWLNEYLNDLPGYSEYIDFSSKAIFIRAQNARKKHVLEERRRAALEQQRRKKRIEEKQRKKDELEKIEQLRKENIHPIDDLRGIEPSPSLRREITIIKSGNLDEEGKIRLLRNWYHKISSTEMLNLRDAFPESRYFGRNIFNDDELELLGVFLQYISVRSLYLDNNNLSIFSGIISNTLRNICLMNVPLVAFDNNNLPVLTRLFLSDTKLKSFKNNNLASLITLSLSCSRENELSVFEDNSLQSLEELSLSDARLECITNNHFKLLRRLKVSSSPLFRGYDCEIFNQLTHLSLVNCALKEFSATWIRNLKYLDLSHNNLTRFLGYRLPCLEALILKNNYIISFNGKYLRHLKALDLSMNEICNYFLCKIRKIKGVRFGCSILARSFSGIEKQRYRRKLGLT